MSTEPIITVGPIIWTSQHDAMEASIAMFRHQLERHIREWWGDRCEDFDPDCFCCQKWAAFDQVVENNLEQRTGSSGISRGDQ